MYTGHEWDGVLGQYHYRARIYEATVRRFCSRDPIGYKGSEWNLFEYVNSVPLVMLDPSGLQVDSLSGMLKQCASKPTVAAQIECYELFISQGMDKTGVMRQIVARLKYGRQSPPPRNPRKNRKGTKCTEAQHTYYHRMVYILCKLTHFHAKKGGSQSALSEGTSGKIRKSIRMCDCAIYLSKNVLSKNRFKLARA